MFIVASFSEGRNLAWTWWQLWPKTWYCRPFEVFFRSGH